MEEDNSGLIDSETHSNASLFLGSMICSRSEICIGTGDYENMNDDNNSLLITLGHSVSGQKDSQEYVENGSTEHQTMTSDLGPSFIMTSSGTHSNFPTSSSAKPDTPSVVSHDSLSLPSSSTQSQTSTGSLALMADISVLQSPVPLSSSSAFCIGVSSAHGVVSPLQLLSPLLLPAPLQPLFSSPTSSSLAQSFTDLKPLTLMSCSVEGHQIPIVSSSLPTTSSKNIGQSVMHNSLKTSGYNKTRPSAPQTLRSSRTYDFSPSSKDSPLKPLKSLRRRPPPPPLGSHKGRKNYFSVHKQSNLRRAVLEKSLMKKSPESQTEAKIATSKSVKKFDPVDPFPPDPTENLHLPLHASKQAVQTPGIAVNVERSVVNDSANNRSSIDSRPVLKLLEKVTDATSRPNVSGSFLRKPSECLLEKSKDACRSVSDHSSAPVNKPLLNKRKRGRPRKNESITAPDDVSLNDVYTSKVVPQNTPPREILTAMVTRHSTHRRENNGVTDDIDEDFSPPPKRACRRRFCAPATDLVFTRSARRKNQSSDVEQQFISSNSGFKNTVEPVSKGGTKNEGREKRNSQKYAIALQGGFKKSREFRSHYIQTSSNEDILFPHITQEDVCLFKLANQFYKEHKDKSYDLFSQDEDSNETDEYYQRNNNINPFLRSSFNQSRSSKIPTNLEQIKTYVLAENKSEEITSREENKAEASNVLVKRGRGRPKINRDSKEMQVVSESERKKKKLISSILRELGSQGDAKKVAADQSTSDINCEPSASGSQPCTAIKPPTTTECHREVRSFVTFVTPRKHPREECESVDSTPPKKICKEKENRPSIFLSFGSDVSSPEKNFISFESLISRSASPCASSSSIALTTSCNSVLLNKQTGKNAVRSLSENLIIPAKPLDGCQKEITSEVHPKCSCMHQCGLRDTYLSPPFKRPSGQTSNLHPVRVDSQSSVLALSYPPLPQPFFYPNLSTSPSFLSIDPHKSILFPSTEGLKDQQQQTIGNSVRMPGSNLPFVMLCHQDNMNLVMTNGCGYYALPVAVDDKMQFPSVNQPGQIFVPYVINHYATPQPDNKKSEQEVVSGPERPISSQSMPLPTPSSAPSSSPLQHPLADTFQQTPSSKLLNKSSSTSDQLDVTNGKSSTSANELCSLNNHVEVSSINYNNQSTLSSSYLGNDSLPENNYHEDSIRNTDQFNPVPLINRDDPTMYHSTNGNSFNSSSNLGAFSSDNNRIMNSYYNDCSPRVRYFHSAQSHYDQFLETYNSPRLSLGSAHTTHLQSHVNNLRGYVSRPQSHPRTNHIYDNPQFAYCSYADGFANHSLGRLELSNKQINSFRGRFRNETHLQRLSKTAQNENDTSLWN